MEKLVAKTSMHAIYDDHDFGMDDCVPGSLVDEPKWKKHVLANFSKNWNNPPVGGGKQNPGCWQTFSLGKVQFIMLDCRYYRDRKEKSMLGSFQKKWLKDTLQHSNATFKVIASSVPFSEGIKPGSRDPWDGYPEEREEIFSFIEKQKIEGVLLIAADRHRIDLEKSCDLTVMTSLNLLVADLQINTLIQLFIRMASFGDIIKVGLLPSSFRYS